MRIEYLYRYPVKGLTAEALEAAEVEEGGCIPWDRAFALAQGDSGFDPAAPQWLQKANFMCQMKDARIAALFSFFEPRTGMLAIRAPDGSSVVENALTEAGRERIGAFLTGVSRRGRARRAALPPCPRAQLLRPAAQGGQPDQPRQPARLRGEGGGAPAPAAVPRQCLVQRRRGVERARLGRPAAPGRRRGAAGDQADHPLCRRPR